MVVVVGCYSQQDSITSVYTLAGDGPQMLEASDEGGGGGGHGGFRQREAL